MSIFASQSTETIPLPFDVPHTVTIRALTGQELERAQAEHFKGLMNGQRSARGWAEAFQRKLVAGIVPAAAVLADPLNGYDRHTINLAAVLGWSYPDPPTPETIADLVDDAAEWIARAILQKSKPGLFLTADEAEAEKKTDSAGSTGP